MAWLVRGAVHAMRPEDRKSALVGARWPKPHLSGVRARVWVRIRVGVKVRD